ncbi:MAG: GNAT family N-acetyltransferase [Pseudomonadota bacterium]
MREIELLVATAPEDVAAAARLIRAYADWLDVDLCFQDFEQELAALPGAYGPPRGRLLLAKQSGAVMGCVALRPLEADICEMKRLWVEPGSAGKGIGRTLARRAVADARQLGYRAMRLDTIPERMPAAQELYRSLGFVEIPAYYHNPLEGVVMLEVTL